MTRLLGRFARIVLNFCDDVQCKEDWVETMTNPPIEYFKHVDIFEVLDHVLAQRAKCPPREHSPHPASIIELRKTPAIASYEMMNAHSSFDDTTLYDHQSNAIDSTLAIEDTKDGNRELVAMSGIWIKPCGSGKTLAAARYAVAIGTRTLVIVPNIETALHWKSAFRDLNVHNVHIQSSYGNEANNVKHTTLLSNAPSVVIITYVALATTIRRGVRDSSIYAVLCIHVLQYGLCIMDEGHMLPAETYELATLHALRARVWLAVTAEPKRSDGREWVLAKHVGPTLFELTMQDAQEKEVIAPVERFVVELSANIIKLGKRSREVKMAVKRHSAIADPEKMSVLAALLVSDKWRKVAIFCDNVSMSKHILSFTKGLELASRRNHVGIFDGQSTTEDRVKFLEAMRSAPRCMGVMTTAGSAAIDVRDLDLLVEVDVCDASLQKVVQRAGRVQRIHPHKQKGCVIMLVTNGSHEVGFAQNRVEMLKERNEHVEWISLNKGEDVMTRIT